MISGQFLTSNYICRFDQKVSNFGEEGTDPFLVQKTGGRMKSSNIGGQAVLEGIMMKNGNQYAVAVRKPDKEIAVDIQEYKSVIPCKPLMKIPFIRSIFNFVDSLVLGMKTLMFSASFFEEEEETEVELTEEAIAKKEKQDKLFMNLTVAFSVVLAVAIFMVLPYFLSNIMRKHIASRGVITILEGVIRLAIFLGYILLVSRMEDIQRTFMYHGAEHKCINCIEHGLILNTDNVRKSSKQHKRCGTSFLFFVMIVSIIFCFFITAESQVMRVVLRIALLPLIAGVSYEIIKLAGNSDNYFINLLSKPGMWVQNLTTKEPDDSMIEVAICAVEAVFDWKAYLAENFGTQLPAGTPDEKTLDQVTKTVVASGQTAGQYDMTGRAAAKGQQL